MAEERRGPIKLPNNSLNVLEQNAKNDFIEKAQDIRALNLLDGDINNYYGDGIISPKTKEIDGGVQYSDSNYNSKRDEDKKRRYGELPNDDSNQIAFLPEYSVSDYIIERNNWRKQLNNITGHIGWFYFKIFFNFNTSYGLLGGILNNGNDNNQNQLNTAYQYLNNIENIKMYSSLKLKDRKKALEKFTFILSYISSQAPWFFNKVEGIENIKGAYTDNFNDEKTISIYCLEEAIDMRLGTLFDLYKFACYDNINCKEIIPSNLRKFEMSIMVFTVPLKLYQTGFKLYDSNIGEKEISVSKNGNDFSNTMSFKMYTFQNCEFDVNSMNEITESLDNTNSFSIGKSKINIKYDRVYEHRMNEWEGYMFGSDGFYYDKKPNNERIKILSDLQKNPRSYGQLQLTGEQIAETFLIDTKLNIGLGNVYGTYTNTKSKYYQDKLKFLTEGTIESGNIYNYQTGRTGNDANRTNSKYLDKKLDNIKYGTVKGNLFGYNTGREGDDSNRHNTEYLDKKLSRMTDCKVDSDMPDISIYGTKNEYSVRQDKQLNIEQDATLDLFKLNWDADAIRNSNNMYSIDGLDSNKTTWIGRLMESTWKRTKYNFGF